MKRRGEDKDIAASSGFSEGEITLLLEGTEYTEGDPPPKPEVLERGAVVSLSWRESKLVLLLATGARGRSGVSSTLVALGIPMG